MSLLSISDLSVRFTSGSRVTDAVKSVSLNIDAGEIVALVGESGSGKSVTALSIMQLLESPPASYPSGSIRFEGSELMGQPYDILKEIRGNDIAMIFQEPMSALNPLHTIGRQIGEMLALHQPFSRKEREAQIKTLLEEVGLRKFIERLGVYPHELSGGERQRVMIAMALANNPKLLIADEPTTALDVTVQQQILKLLKKLQKERDMAVLLITHDLTIVRKVADRVAVMKDGKLVEVESIETIFSTPKHQYTRHLLSSEPKGEAVSFKGNPKPLIECSEIKVYFPIRTGFLKRVTDYVKAVDGVSVVVPEQSAFGIVGESGSGKTTLALALLRLVKSQGPIVFQGKSLDDLSAREMLPLRHQMQLVFQDPFSSLNPRMSIYQIISEGLHVHFSHFSDSQKHDKVEKVMGEVDLDIGMLDRYPHEFSGGQRQRISIARALVLEPELIVLDEPTSALDVSVQAQIIDLLKQLQKDKGLTYLFISHDLRVVRALCHEVIVMKDGKVVEHGPTKSIFDNPQTDYTQELIEAAFPKKVA